MPSHEEHLEASLFILNMIHHVRTTPGPKDTQIMVSLIRSVDEHTTMQWTEWAAKLTIDGVVAQLRAERDEARGVAETMRTEHAQNYGGEEYALPWDIDYIEGEDD